MSGIKLTKEEHDHLNRLIARRRIIDEVLGWPEMDRMIMVEMLKDAVDESLSAENKPS